MSQKIDRHSIEDPNDGLKKSFSELKKTMAWIQRLFILILILTYLLPYFNLAGSLSVCEKKLNQLEAK